MAQNKTDVRATAEALVKEMIDTYPNESLVVDEDGLKEIKEILKSALSYLEDMILQMSHIEMEEGKFYTLQPRNISEQ